MKKVIVMLGLMLFAMFLVVTPLVKAADNGEFLIKVHIVEDPVGLQIGADSLDFGYIVKGSSRTSYDQSTTVKNIGVVNVTYRLRISSVTPYSNWTIGSANLNDTGVDKFVLAAVFHSWDGLIYGGGDPVARFGNEDILTTTDKTAGTADTGTFAANTGCPNPTPADKDGYNSPSNEQLNVLYFFNAPTSLSQSAQYTQEQTIKVRITAQQQ